MLAVVAVSSVVHASAAQSAASRELCKPQWRRVARWIGPPLTDVAAISARDVWLVGGYIGNGITSRERGLPLAVHWDGHRLRQFKPFTPTGHNEGRYSHEGQLDAVSATAPGDVWAVGVQGFVTGAPVIAHWDGRSWRRVSLPSIHGLGYLNDVLALSRNDVWAVGQIGNLGGPDSRPLILHWDGRRWRRFDVRTVVHSSSDLRAIAAVSPDDIWAVGGSSLDAPDIAGYDGLVMHWDGQRWHEVAAAEDGWTGSAVAATSTDDVWILGWQPATDDEALLRWNGRTLRRMRGASDLGNLAVVGKTDVWASGGVLVRWNGKQLETEHPSFPPSTSLSVISPSDAWGLGATRHWQGLVHYSCTP